jgi:hypothetical protein
MGDDIGDGAQSGVAREGEAEVAGGGGRGMEEGAEAAVTAPRLRGRAGRGLCGGADGGYDTVGFRGAEGDTGGGGCGMRGAGGGTMKPVDAHGRYI